MRIRISQIAFLILLLPALTEAQVKRVFLFDTFMQGKSTLHTGDSLNIWGFQQIVPSPLPRILPSPNIECNLGDTVEISLINTSFDGHTLHLHGLDVDQANDGVPSTSFFVQPGDTGTYTFIAKYTGNYIYHCHVTSVLHVQMGMYGMVIVRGPNGKKEAYPGGPGYTHEYAWLGAEIDKSWHDDFTSIGPFTNFFPDYFHVSGKSRQKIWQDSTLSMYNHDIGDSILLRLFNIGFGIQEYKFPSNSNARILTSDGRAIKSNPSIETLKVYPGERYGILLTPKILFQDSIQIRFLNMLRHQEWGREGIPIQVNNVNTLSPPKPGNTLTVYPNPAENTLHLNAKPEGHYRIVNQFGKLLLEGKFSGEAISISSLSPGLYVLEYRFGSQRLKTKFIKNK